MSSFVSILSQPTLWVWIPLRQGVFDTTLCDKACQWLAAGGWFSPTSKSDSHDTCITEILLKVALNSITPLLYQWDSHDIWIYNVFFSVWSLIHQHHTFIKVMWLLNYLAFQSFDLSVPDESYSRNASCGLNLISTFLLHEYPESSSYIFYLL